MIDTGKSEIHTSVNSSLGTEEGAPHRRSKVVVMGERKDLFLFAKREKGKLQHSEKLTFVVDSFALLSLLVL